MADLISTLSLTAGSYIKAKAIATNDRGSSPVSEASDDTVKTQVAPTVAPSSLAGTATKDSITLTWNQVTADADIGYSVVKEYRVYDVTGGGDTLVATTTAPTVTTTLTSLTTAGDTFTYQVAAYNIHGEGPRSSSYSQLLAGIPDTMDAPVITQSGTTLTFAWTPPNDNGESIDSYQLLLFDRNDDTYREWKDL